MPTPYEHLPDEVLILHVQEGEVVAFSEIVRRYQQRLFWFVRRLTGDDHAAEDVVQESFLKLYQTIQRVDLTKRFSTYLFAIAKNETISSWRKSKTHVPLEDVEIPDDDLIEERLTKDSEAAEVHQAIEHLDEKYRQVVRLYYFDHLSYDDIAQKTDLPLNTVRTHLYRAKELLRDFLSHDPA